MEDLSGRTHIALDKGSRLAVRCKEVLSNMMARFKELEANIGQVSRSAAEEAIGVEGIQKSLGQLHQIAQQNGEVARSNAGAGEKLRAQALQLEQAIRELSSTVQGGGARFRDTGGTPKSPTTPTPTALRLVSHNPAPRKRSSVATRAVANGGSTLPSRDDPRFEDI